MANLGPIQKFSTPNQQRIVFEVEKIKKTNISSPTLMQFFLNQASKPPRKFANIRTTLGFRSTQLTASRCISKRCSMIYNIITMNVLSFVVSHVLTPAYQKPASVCRKFAKPADDELQIDGCTSFSLAGSKLGYQNFDENHQRIRWFHFDDEVWDENSHKLPLVELVMPKENGHSALMQDKDGQSFTGISIIKSSIFGRRGRFEAINNMIEAHQKLSKRDPINNVCPFKRFSESKETVIEND